MSDLHSSSCDEGPNHPGPCHPQKEPSDWYEFSVLFYTKEVPPTDPWEFIQWFRQAMPIAFDEIKVKVLPPRDTP